MDFDLQVRESPRGVTVGVSGDLDVLTAPQLRECVASLVEQGRVDLIIDLRPTEFLDSSGLSALVGAVKRVRAEGGDLGIICPPGNVRRLIEVVGLDQVFSLYDSPESAEGRSAPPGG